MQLAAVMRVCPECRASSHSVLPKMHLPGPKLRVRPAKLYYFQGCKVNLTRHTIAHTMDDMHLICINHCHFMFGMTSPLPGGGPFSCGPWPDHCLMRGACD